MRREGAWHTDDESNLVRHVLPLALVSLTACTASHGLVITRSATNATVSVDAEQMPENEAARTQRLQALAVKACHGAGRVTTQRLSTRDDVELDLDRVWATFLKNGAPTSWTQPAGPANPLNTRSTIWASAWQAQPDERSVRIQIPVWELSIECGG